MARATLRTPPHEASLRAGAVNLADDRLADRRCPVALCPKAVRNDPSDCGRCRAGAPLRRASGNGSARRRSLSTYAGGSLLRRTRNDCRPTRRGRCPRSTLSSAAKRRDWDGLSRVSAESSAPIVALAGDRERDTSPQRGTSSWRRRAPAKGSSGRRLAAPRTDPRFRSPFTSPRPLRQAPPEDVPGKRKASRVRSPRSARERRKPCAALKRRFAR